MLCGLGLLFNGQVAQPVDAVVGGLPALAADQRCGAIPGELKVSRWTVEPGDHIALPTKSLFQGI
jgi:hypothetical protein